MNHIISCNEIHGRHICCNYNKQTFRQENLEKTKKGSKEIFTKLNKNIFSFALPRHFFKFLP